MALLRQGFLAGLKANMLCTLNGRYEPTLSTIFSPIHEIELMSMYSAERKNSRSLEQHFARLADAKDNPFVDLNTALCSHGIVIRVPEGKKVRAHTFIYHLADATQHHPLAQPRVLVVVGAGSSLDITEVFEAQGGHASTTNAVLEVYLGEGATINLTKLQKSGNRAQLLDSTFIYHEAGAKSETITLSLSGKVVRNNLTCTLAGEGSHAGLQGLYLCQTGVHIDNHTEVRHMVPNCTSDELYKGIADGKGVSVFNGKIFVAQDAQKTNAFQSNRNLLLSDDAVVNTKPQLEIYADDVRCTHGATIGQLPEDAMFYMQARGIGKEAARGLLLGAFAAEVADKIVSEPVRAEAHRLLDAWFAAR
jgi:Fe-S cluster assembly protein SufD